MKRLGILGPTLLCAVLAGCGGSDGSATTNAETETAATNASPVAKSAEAPAPRPTEQSTAATQPAPLPIWGYDVIARYPHTDEGFTQGLFVNGGVLYETTGQRGESAIIRHDELGSTDATTKPLPSTVFGEGSVAVDGEIISLTWRAGIGHVHSLDTLELIDTFPLAGEGWGLTYDGVRLIMSDGTDRLRYLDPETREEIGGVSVRAGARALTRLNELEFIDGEVWANIWQTDVIARIDADSGAVLGFINLQGLYRDPVAPTNHVLNGIAWDDDAGRLFVTGKRWPEIFEIRIVKP